MKCFGGCLGAAALQEGQAPGGSTLQHYPYPRLGLPPNNSRGKGLAPLLSIALPSYGANQLNDQWRIFLKQLMLVDGTPFDQLTKAVTLATTMLELDMMSVVGLSRTYQSCTCLTTAGPCCSEWQPGIASTLSPCSDLSMYRLMTGQAALHSSSMPHSAWPVDWQQTGQVHAVSNWVAVPLQTSQGVVGMLTLGHRSTHILMSERCIVHLETLAALLSRLFLDGQLQSYCTELEEVDNATSITSLLKVISCNLVQRHQLKLYSGKVHCRMAMCSQDGGTALLFDDFKDFEELAKLRRSKRSVDRPLAAQSMSYAGTGGQLFQVANSSQASSVGPCSWRRASTLIGVAHGPVADGYASTVRPISPEASGSLRGASASGPGPDVHAADNGLKWTTSHLEPSLRRRISQLEGQVVGRTESCYSGKELGQVQAHWGQEQLPPAAGTPFTGTGGAQRSTRSVGHLRKSIEQHSASSLLGRHASESGYLAGKRLDDILSEVYPTYEDEDGPLDVLRTLASANMSTYEAVEGTVIKLDGTVLGCAVKERQGFWVQDCAAFMQDRNNPNTDVFLATSQGASGCMIVNVMYHDGMPVMAVYLVLSQRVACEVLEEISRSMNEGLSVLQPMVWRKLTDDLLEEWSYMQRHALAEQTLRVNGSLKRAKRTSVELLCTGSLTRTTDLPTVKSGRPSHHRDPGPVIRSISGHHAMDLCVPAASTSADVTPNPPVGMLETVHLPAGKAALSLAAEQSAGVGRARKGPGVLAKLVKWVKDGSGRGTAAVAGTAPEPSSACQVPGPSSRPSSFPTMPQHTGVPLEVARNNETKGSPGSKDLSAGPSSQPVPVLHDVRGASAPQVSSWGTQLPSTLSVDPALPVRASELTLQVPGDRPATYPTDTITVKFQGIPPSPDADGAHNPVRFTLSRCKSSKLEERNRQDNESQRGGERSQSIRRSQSMRMPKAAVPSSPDREATPTREPVNRSISTVSSHRGDRDHKQRALSFRVNVGQLQGSSSGKRISALIIGLQDRVQEAQRQQLNQRALAPQAEDLLNIKVLSKIGAGGFSSCFLAFYQGSQVALKVILERNDTSVEVFRHAVELAVTSTLSHPNIVQVITFFTDVGVSYPSADALLSGDQPPIILQPPEAAYTSGLSTSSFQHMMDSSVDGAINNGNSSAYGPGPQSAKVAAAGQIQAHDSLSESMLAAMGISPQDLRPAKSVKPAKAKKALVIVMEYCDAGTLWDAILDGVFRLPHTNTTTTPGSNCNWVAIYQTLLEVASALRYLHSLSLVHRDLKPQNVLLKESPSDTRGFTCKLSDFGLTKLGSKVPKGSEPASNGNSMEGLDGRAASRPGSMVDDGMVGTSPAGSPQKTRGPTKRRYSGTVTHLPPEALDQTSEGYEVDASADIYALGIMMWELASSQSAYGVMQSEVIIERVVDHSVRPEFSAGTPQEYKDLACRCWHADHRMRPTADTIVHTLNGLLAAVQKDRVRKRASRLSLLTSPDSRFPGDLQPPPGTGPLAPWAYLHDGNMPAGHDGFGAAAGSPPRPYLAGSTVALQQHGAYPPADAAAGDFPIYIL